MKPSQKTLIQENLLDSPGMNWFKFRSGSIHSRGQKKGSDIHKNDVKKNRKYNHIADYDEFRARYYKVGFKKNQSQLSEASISSFSLNKNLTTEENIDLKVSQLCTSKSSINRGVSNSPSVPNDRRKGGSQKTTLLDFGKLSSTHQNSQRSLYSRRGPLAVNEKLPSGKPSQETQKKSLKEKESFGRASLELKGLKSLGNRPSSSMARFKSFQQQLAQTSNPLLNSETFINLRTENPFRNSELELSKKSEISEDTKGFLELSRRSDKLLYKGMNEVKKYSRPNSSYSNRGKQKKPNFLSLLDFNSRRLAHKRVPSKKTKEFLRVETGASEATVKPTNSKKELIFTQPINMEQKNRMTSEEREIKKRNHAERSETIVKDILSTVHSPTQRMVQQSKEPTISSTMLKIKYLSNFGDINNMIDVKKNSGHQVPLTPEAKLLPHSNSQPIYGASLFDSSLENKKSGSKKNQKTEGYDFSSVALIDMTKLSRMSSHIKLIDSNKPSGLLNNKVHARTQQNRPSLYQSPRKVSNPQILKSPITAKAIWQSLPPDPQQYSSSTSQTKPSKPSQISQISPNQHSARKPPSTSSDLKRPLSAQSGHLFELKQGGSPIQPLQSILKASSSSSRAWAGGKRAAKKIRFEEETS